MGVVEQDQGSIGQGWAGWSRAGRGLARLGRHRPGTGTAEQDQGSIGQGWAGWSRAGRGRGDAGRGRARPSKTGAASAGARLGGLGPGALERETNLSG
jgi:hypothetical protein